MANFTDRITLVVDVVTGKATTQLGQLKTAMAGADTTTGKLKAGVSQLGSQFGQYLGPAALAAGAALVTFGAKSVRAFEETALAAKKFSDATGIAIEDASRWIEVAGDIGISSEQMTGAFARLNKALGEGNLKQWGIDADNATDGFLQTVEALRKIEDPTQRALLAQQAFGKGYTQIAELTTMSAEDLREALDDVSDAKVIDEDEVRKAEKLREAQDRLKDSLEDIALTLGEELAPAFENAADAVSVFGEALDAIPGSVKDILTAGWDDIYGAFEDAFKGKTPWEDSLIDAKSGIDGIVQSLDDGRRGGSGFFDEIGDGADDATDAILETADAIDVLKGRLEVENEMLDIRDSFQQMKDAAIAAYGAGVEGAADAAAQARDAQRATNDLKLDVIDYGREVLGLPDEKLTAILALIDQGSLDAAEQRLAILARNRTATVSIVSRGGAGYGGITGPFHSGGVVPGPRGSEQLALVKAGETILPTHTTGSGTSGVGGISITVNAGLGADGSEIGRIVVQEIERYTRRNGTTI